METTSLIEVFSVIYFGHDEITPDKQIGTIKVDDHLHVNYLYNVDKVDMTSPSIKYGDEIMLTGPTIAPILGGITVFDLDLFGGTYKDCMHFDCLPDYIEFEPLKRVISSKDGTGEICVLYSLFKDVASAHVEVVLTDVQSTDHFYGVVAASTSMIERPDYTSTLFLRKPEQGIKLGPGDRIPLSRSIVAVPLESRLFLDVLLCEKDDEIVKGSLEFFPQPGIKAPPQFIGSNKGRIKVNVSWKSAALTPEDQELRDKKKLEFVLRFLCETMNEPKLSLCVYPL